MYSGERQHPKPGDPAGAGPATHDRGRPGPEPPDAGSRGAEAPRDRSLLRCPAWHRCSGRPAGGDHASRRCRLCRSRQHRRAGDGRQRGVGGLVDRAGLHHRGQLDRAGVALQPDVLTLGRVQELLPQTRRRGVRGVLADRLVVVLAQRRARRDRRPSTWRSTAGPRRRRRSGKSQLITIGHWPGLDQARRVAVGGVEVAQRLQACLKNVRPGLMLSRRAAVVERGGPDGAERRVGRHRAAVQGDVVLVLRALELSPGGRAARDDRSGCSRTRRIRRSRCTSRRWRPC